MSHAKLLRLRTKLAKAVEDGKYAETQQNLTKQQSLVPPKSLTKMAIRACRAQARLENQIADLEYELRSHHDKN